MGNDLISETLRSIGTIVVVTLTGAAIGLLFGCLLGSLAPDLFRAFFGGRRIEGGPTVSVEGFPLDPRQIAIGLGLINGAIMGFIAGLVTVIASAWLRGRRIAAGSE
jgi:hypothetical protein